MPRPTLYTDQIKTEILVRIAGGESIHSISKSAHMPARATIQQWKLDYQDFAVECMNAFKIKMEIEFDQMIDLVDNCQVADIAKVREQISVRKWLLKVTEPKRFGDSPEPVTPVAATDYSSLTDDELDQLLILLKKAKG